MKLSIVTPVYNEAGSLDLFLKELFCVLGDTGVSYEIIAIDDGSRDESFAILSGAAAAHKELKVIRFQGNHGQTAAISAGILHAQGEVVILLDSDLENDPRDISLLLKKINEGYDVVSGWRKDRWRGKFLTRKLPSICANLLISKITGVKLHDYGCTLKAYKSEIIGGVQLYGEMHRFIPAYAARKGARVGEIPVGWRKRIAGKSNYGLSRIFYVMLDLIVIKFLDAYMNKPMHFFGGLGFLSFFLGIVAGVSAVVLKVLGLRSFIATPLPVLAALFIIVGVQLAAMGVISEILMRTYYESQGKKPYQIKEKINFR